ncbi:hypothetical protein E3E12_00465 [Formicincola oecophyllae]|uniref:Uncharacterized protein n=1 Tax=Formicincola oecophyllae TaxID=2558361 RepID=A0A4Y6U900_9PROT|nr:hypothetical protein [Formicincola oecophyllae]QDH12927.1 hypothetical protein E3E12_00465 [Formicincola oecophyllae]
MNKKQKVLKAVDSALKGASELGFNSPEAQVHYAQLYLESKKQTMRDNTSWEFWTYLISIMTGLISLITLILTVQTALSGNKLSSHQAFVFIFGSKFLAKIYIGITMLSVFGWIYYNIRSFRRMPILNGALVFLGLSPEEQKRYRTE